MNLSLVVALPAKVDEAVLLPIIFDVPFNKSLANPAEEPSDPLNIKSNATAVDPSEFNAAYNSSACSNLVV